jgi:non-specific serine/threonine protein kinase/serine/threonine-protein kinase
MGVVFEAEQREPVRRRVALKVIQVAAASGEFLARFEVERQALALMDHPGIAKIFDAGRTVDGRPFYAMEYVDGEALTTFCDSRSLSARDRLQVFIKLCRAVQHAHTKGIVHRDLKPANVLVAIADNQPAPKVIDFGIAKSLGGEMTDEELTQHGHAVGTPAYMAPEQVRAGVDAIDVDTRADVYSLGAMLYELLVGHRAFDKETVRRPDFLYRHLKGELEPVTPSARLAELGETGAAVASKRDTEVATLRRELQGDLDWIVMRAMARDRERRYETVHDLVLDIERYLDHRPVVARPPSAGYRMSRFVRRHRLGVSVAAVLVLGLTAGVIGTTVGLLRARAAEARATQEAEASKRVSQFLANMLGSVDPNAMGKSLMTDLEARVSASAEKRGENAEQKAATLSQHRAAMRGVNATDAGLRLLDEEVLARASQTIGEELETDPMVAGRLQHEIGNTYKRLGILEKALSHLEQAWEIRRAALGEGHAETLLSRRVRARTLWLLGRDEEAFTAMKAALVEARRSLGDDHPITLGMRRTVAELTSEHVGRLEEAVPLLRDVVAAYTRVLGPEHEDTLVANVTFAHSLMRVEQYEEAEKLLRRTLAIRKRLLGPDHLDVIATELSLSGALSMAGKNDEAPTVLAGLHERAERSLGEGHYLTFAILYETACMNARMGKPEEALNWLEELADRGYPDAAWTRKDPELASLREDPRFEEVLKRMEASAH